jgi:hypothetical protein
MNSFLRKLRWLTRRSDKEAQLREELQFHLDEEAQWRQDDGLTKGEAESAARRELGNLALVEETRGRRACLVYSRSLDASSPRTRTTKACASL